MMTAIVRKPGVVGDALPGGVDVARLDAWADRPHDGVESHCRDFRHQRILLADAAKADQPAKRGMIARDAAGEFDEDRLALAVDARAPARVFLAETRDRADEGAEA